MNLPTTPHTPAGTPARSIAILVAMLLISGVVTVIATYAALEWMPCQWFGSSFEGGCGYGALWTAAGVALLLWPLLFLGAAALYFRRARSTNAAQASAASDVLPSARLVTQWRVVLGLTLLAQLLPMALVLAHVNFSPEVDTVLRWLALFMLVLNAVLVYRIAARSQRQWLALVLALISVLFGWMGAAGVGIYLHSELRRRR